MPADDGPPEWQRIDVTPDLDRRLEEGDPNGPRVDIVVPADPIEAVPLPPVDVSNVEIGESSVAFDVDEVGVPVLVKVSYFPNWKASGADGPYRIGPNMMVVIPDETHVVLEYGRTPIDYASILLTLVGVGLCFWWRREGDIVHAGPTPMFGRAATGDDLDDSDDFDDSDGGGDPDAAAGPHDPGGAGGPTLFDQSSAHDGAPGEGPSPVHTPGDGPDDSIDDRSDGEWRRVEHAPDGGTSADASAPDRPVEPGRASGEPRFDR